MSILAICSEQARAITSGLAAVVTASLLTNCASAPTFSRTVYEDSTVVVRLDRSVFQEEVPNEPAGHTPELTVADLVEILRSVRIQPEISFLSYWVLRKEPQPEPAFPNDDASLIAPHLLAALIKARANEIAVFALRRAREDGIPIVTTGGVHIHGDQLIVLLANTRRPTTTPPRLDSARKAPLVPLGEPDFHIVPGPYQTSLTTEDLPKHIIMKSVPAVLVNYRTLLTSFAQPNRGSDGPEAGAEVSTATIEEKLHRLKTWHEQGLITDDEYRHKRQELLKRF